MTRDITIAERVKLLDYLIERASPEMIQKALDEIRASLTIKTLPTIEFIQNEVCRYLGVTPDELQSNSKHKNHAYARLIFARTAWSIYDAKSQETATSIRGLISKQINKSRFMVTKYLDNENKVYLSDKGCRSDIAYLSTLTYLKFLKQSENE
jgi:hypothetical protein